MKAVEGARPSKKDGDDQELSKPVLPGNLAMASCFVNRGEEESRTWPTKSRGAKWRPPLGGLHMGAVEGREVLAGIPLLHVLA